MARGVREQFVAAIDSCLDPLADAIGSRLQELADRAPSTRDAQIRRDALMQFERRRSLWLAKTRKALKAAAAASPAPAQPRVLNNLNLELIGDDVVENKILASRLAMAIEEKASWELNDLKVRMQALEGCDELSSEDVVLPPALSLLLIDEWVDSDLPRPTWQLLPEVIAQHIVPTVVKTYRLANEDLIRAGVVPDVEASLRVKRAGGASRRTPVAAEPGPEGFAAGDLSAAGSDWGGLAASAGTGSPGSAGGWGAQAAGSGTPAAAGGAGGFGHAAGPGGPGGPGGAGAPAGVGAPGGPGSPNSFGAPNGYGAPGGFGTPGASGAPGSFPAPIGPTAFGAPGGGAAGGLAPAGGFGESRGHGASGHVGAPQGAGGALAAPPGGFAPAPGAPAGAPGAAAPWQGGAAAAGGPYPGATASWNGAAPGAGPSAPPGRPAANHQAAADAGLAGRPTWGAQREDGLQQTAANTPLLRARARAQGVIGQLKRLLVERVAGFDVNSPLAASSALTEALTVHSTQLRTQVQARHGGDSVVYDDVAVQQLARDLRERSGALKEQAATSAEKAVIEVVALMFQSILAEERIPPAVRVWVARLQMPVLRVALSEPEFFGSLQHPARQLIDRMGSCVMGFDASSIGGSALEVEIRRIVQLIEQYPETGRRVFQLALDEFQKFLSRFLTERGDTQRLVTVAQQVEQKETMAVRYTIELRKMLADMPVRDEIRSFLFKVWAEVLAVAAVKHGPQHADTLALKKSASDLVWAASAKPSRADRAQVIQGLPGLLQRLRQGMTLLGLEAGEQEDHIKLIGDTLADAFQSKTAAIPAARIEAIAHRLANLEEFVGDEDPEGDLPLVAESIELMLGMQADGIHVITDGGTQPNAAMLAWARELQPGTWFSLDHNGQLQQVQYAWRSERGQLHLFASMGGRSFLFQVGRLAAYLQAGLVLPAEEEALTVRATRDALAKIDANPERLFA